MRPPSTPAADVTTESSAAEQLAAAIRRIVREEAQFHVTASGVEPPVQHGAHETVSVGLFIINIVLLYTCLPRSVVNKDLIDFVAKVATFVGGGLALLNPVGFRRTLLAHLSVPAFLPVNILTFVLLVGALVGRVPVRFEVIPPTALVIVDDTVTRRSGERFWLTIANHKLRLHPGEGDITVGDTKTKIQDRELPFSWLSVIAHAWPWSNTPRVALLSTIFVSFEEDGRYAITVSRRGFPFDAAFRRISNEFTFSTAFGAQRDTPGIVGSDSFQLPFGQYDVTVVAKDRGAADCRTSMPFTVDERSNELRVGPIRCAR